MMKQPNILFLMTDQQRWDALGCVNPHIKTPNLDALAKEGILFREAVCQGPICVPSRYSMMFGLYPSQSGVLHNQSFYGSDDKMPVPVMAQRLQSQGYLTCGIGKTHWYIKKTSVGEGNIEPSTRGFAQRYGDEGNGILAPRAIEREQNEFVDIEREEIKKCGPGGETPYGYTGKTAAIGEEHFVDSWRTQKAMEFLDEYAVNRSEEPFFLYLSLEYPHPGFVVPPEYEAMYDMENIPDRIVAGEEDEIMEHAFRREPIIEEWKRKTPEERKLSTLRYWALCTYVDTLIGKVLDKLEEIGEKENTLIVFTSDHGEMLGERNHRFSKYCLYEGSVRVPLIFAGKGVPEERKGTVDKRPAELVDILPTILNSIGAEIPEELPGIDLMGEFRKSGSICEYHGGGYEKVQEAPAIMWRTPEWKLILHIPGVAAQAFGNIDKAEGELYHLTEDPVELHNLYMERQYHALREKLTRDCLLHLMSAYCRFPRAQTVLTPISMSARSETVKK